MHAPESAKQATRLAVEAIRIVAGYFDQRVQPCLASLKVSNPKVDYLVGIMYRAAFHAQSLAALRHFLHFQATASVYRAVLELIVDAILVSYDEPPDVLRRIETWEESAMLNYAEPALKYMKDVREPIDSAWQSVAEFVTDKRESIRESRRSLWKAARHPPRWTGQSLERDIQTADKLHGSGLRELYEKDYRRLNWQIHGASLVAVRRLDVSGFCSFFYLSQKNSADILLQLTALFLGQVGLDDSDLIWVRYQWAQKIAEAEDFLDSARP